MYLNFADTREWRTRATSAAEAVSSIRPGDHVFVGTACATPQTLVDALERLDKPPAGVVLTHYLADRVGSYETHYRHRFFFVGRDIRGTRAPTQLEYLPLSLADAPALLSSGRMPVDVALIQVAPPDADGMCSLGISVDVTRAAALAARCVIAGSTRRCRGPAATAASRSSGSTGLSPSSGRWANTSTSRRMASRTGSAPTSRG